jgi:ferric-dicitrate binding protein FerR (iron transport regulator)
MSDYLFDKSGEDAEIADLEAKLGAYAHREPLRETSLRKRKPIMIAAALGAIAVAAVLVLMLVRKPDDPCARATTGMAFSAQGTTRCGGRAASAGTLPVGTWLETTNDAVANMQVATIGNLTMYGNTKLRVLETSDRQHRLELASGRISARVNAPPRLFVVETPAATAVDLGCAYELSVDDKGTTHLVVTSGAVSLEGAHGARWVLHGMEVSAVRGGALGTPIASATSSEIRAAVARFDAGDQTAVRAIVEHATATDIITMWHLVPQVAPADREAVVRKLAEYVPLPFDYEESDMIAATPAALEEWREGVEWEWLLR